MKKINELISVVIPFYNSAEYISNCLNSILRQSYANLEIILVNDGSTDNTIEVIESYLSDSRIKLINIQNGGAANARAIGMENSTGKFISFIDSDDYIDDNYYKILIELAINENADIALCRSTRVHSYDYFEDNTKIININVTSGNQIIDDFLNFRTCIGLCAQLTRRELFDGVEMRSKYKNNEDILINSYLIEKTKKLVCIDNNLYYYYFREKSASTQNVSKNMLNDIYNIAIDIFERYKIVDQANSDICIVNRCSVQAGYNSPQ